MTIKAKKKSLKSQGVLLSAYVPERLKKRVEFLATSRDSTNSEIVTEALDLYFRRRKNLVDFETP